MSGYEIFEQRYLNLYKEEGIDPYKIKIGFLDFLRDLNAGTDGMPRLSSFMVIGIDDVLYMARPNERRNVCLAIHKTLQSAANDLERKMIEIQVVCKGRLFKAESFWLEYRDEKLPVDFIFGTPIRRDIRRVPIYTTSFNLSS